MQFSKTRTCLHANKCKGCIPNLQTHKDSMGRIFKHNLFRRGLTCTVGLANDLVDGGQPS